MSAPSLHIESTDSMIYTCTIEAIEIKETGCSTNPVRLAPLSKQHCLSSLISYHSVWCADSSLRSTCTVLVLSQYAIHYDMNYS